MIVQTLKKILPPSAMARGKTIAYRLKLGVLRTIYRARFLCGLYYFLLSPAFLREQQAVVHGLVRYLDKHEPLSNFYLLRRNTHRLEKGLLMRPRREIFALDYIGETVDCYFRCAHSPLQESRIEDLKWASSVLKRYFSSVTENPIVKTAKEKFEASSSLTCQSEDRTPYKRIVSGSTVTYQQLLALAQQRKSVRWFLQTPVPRALIDQALEVATLAPSACNRQPFRFCIYDDPIMVQKVAAIPLGTVGFSHNIPVIAVVIGDLSAYFGERDRHAIYVDASLAIMLFQLALETIGLASCSLNWPDLASLERKMGSLLQLQPYERVIMSVAIGYADPEGLVAYSQKKSAKELATFNTPPF